MSKGWPARNELRTLGSQVTLLVKCMWYVHTYQNVADLPSNGILDLVRRQAARNNKIHWVRTDSVLTF